MFVNKVKTLHDCMIGESQEKSKPNTFEANSLLTGPDLIDLIGNGSFAKVRRCYHKNLNTVVVKYFALDGSQKFIDEKLEEAAKEAVTLVNINHQNVVKIYGITSWSNYCGIVMEEVTGGTLEDLLFRKVKISITWPLCLKFCVEIADALNYLHNQNPPFVHCDLKPQNILLTDDFVVKLADFGAVKIVQATGTISSFQNLSNNQFTPLYGAPEILRDVYKAKCSCDIYSYAMIIYEIITRERVFFSSSVSLNVIMYQIVHSNLKPDMKFVDEMENRLNADSNDFSIFVHLKDLMLKCWSTDPNERPAASVILDELQTVMGLKIIDIPKTLLLLPQIERQISDKSNQKPLPDCTLSTNEVLWISNNILEYLSLYIKVTYEVVSHLEQDAYPRKVTLKNDGNQCIPSGNESSWSIYFSNSCFLTTKDLKRKYRQYSAISELKLSHIDGTLYKITPTSEFKGLKPKKAIKFYFNSGKIISRYSIFPRWYVCAPNEQPLIIKNTDDDDLGFVTDFHLPKLYKHEKHSDLAFSTAESFYEYNTVEFGRGLIQVIPKTVFMDLNLCNNIKVIVDRKTLFSFFHLNRRFKQFLINQLLENVTEKESKLSFQSCSVNFKQDVVTDVRQCNEAYQITIDSKTNSIDIIAHGQPGAFYATQTLMAVAETQDKALKFPVGMIKDAPRFDYRGLSIDTSSNFIQVDDLLLIIKVMGMYKLNKLILQLSNNEGWRIEINGLPELTEVGAFRRHTDNEDALYPAIGSGPHNNTSGSGYYTIDEYQKILQFASDHCIEVIPRIYMPEQCNAAIFSMKARYNKLKNIDINKAKEFLLNELDEKPSSRSLYKHHIMNPTMESTYRFIDHIVESLKCMHKRVQPLKMLYIGGYGLFHGKWADSKLFDLFKKSNSVSIDIKSFHEYFLYRVTQLHWNKHGIKLGLNSNAAFQMPNEELFDEAVLKKNSVIVYANNENQEQLTLERGYKLANAGFKVVMSHGCYLLLDHVHEPDPDEIGETWASSSIDDTTVFSFKPDNFYRNRKRNKPFQINDSNLSSYTPLNNPNNIIGLQAYLYTELLRNKTMIHSQLFPRLLAFAERAWHKAEWEDDSSSQLKQIQSKDWKNFAYQVGYKEIVRLNNLGINYRIPTPQIYEKKSNIFVCALYPGFQLLYRQYENDKTSEWSEFKSNEFAVDKKLEYDFVAVDFKGRRSRCVKFEPESSPKNFDGNYINMLHKQEINTVSKLAF